MLLGLFLMHGAPATAAGGCHPEMSAAVPVSAGHGTAALTAGDVRPAMVHPVSAPRVVDVSGMYGPHCVSTPARDRVSPAWAGFLVLAGLVVLAARSSAGRGRPRGWAGRRGPPSSGRSLLLQVCIART